MMMIGQCLKKLQTRQQYSLQTSGQGQNEQIVRSLLDLLATLAVATRTAPSETRGQNWIQRQFRGETKPSNTDLAIWADQTYLFASETKRSLELSAWHPVHPKPNSSDQVSHVRTFWVFFFQFLERRFLLLPGISDRHPVFAVSRLLQFLGRCKSLSCSVVVFAVN